MKARCWIEWLDERGCGNLLPDERDGTKRNVRRYWASKSYFILSISYYQPMVRPRVVTDDAARG
jgi:hypothetical protein